MLINRDWCIFEMFNSVKVATCTLIILQRFYNFLNFACCKRIFRGGSGSALWRPIALLSWKTTLKYCVISLLFRWCCLLSFLCYLVLIQCYPSLCFQLALFSQNFLKFTQRSNVFLSFVPFSSFWFQMLRIFNKHFTNSVL